MTRCGVCLWGWDDDIPIQIQERGVGSVFGLTAWDCIRSGVGDWNQSWDWNWDWN